jgi:hypothetical protein
LIDEVENNMKTKLNSSLDFDSKANFGFMKKHMSGNETT